MPAEYYPTGPLLREHAHDEAFETAREDFLLDCRTERTARAYKADLEDFREWCVGLGVEPMAPSPKDIRRYELDLSVRDFSSGTIARRKATVRRFLEHLARVVPREIEPARALPDSNAEPSA